MESAEPSPVRRVLLVGFMASGKTSVGRALARRLGWTFRDFDAEIEAEAGCPVPEIFRRLGEARFRELEGEVGRRLLGEDEVVLAAGGGWPVRDRRMERLPPGTFSVWLRVSPEEAVRRVRNDATVRPLLEGADPLTRARSLLEARTPHYRKAERTLDAEAAPPEGLARTIHEFLTADCAPGVHASS